MTIDEFRGRIEPFIEEYGAAQQELRTMGESLADYIQQGINGEFPPGYQLTPEQREYCDALQLREWGEVASAV